MVPVHSFNGDLVMVLDVQLTVRAARASLAELLGVVVSSLSLVRGLEVLSDNDSIGVASVALEQGAGEGGEGGEGCEEKEQLLVVVHHRALRFATAAWKPSIRNAETRVWCSQSGECLFTLDRQEESAELTISLAFSLDGTRLLTGLTDGTARVFCAETGDSLLLLRGGHTQGVCSVSFSSDSRRALTGSWHGEVSLWCLGAGTLLRTMWGHSSQVMSTAFSSTGERILTLVYDGVVKLWCSETGTCLRTFGQARSHYWDYAMSAAFLSEAGGGGVAFVTGRYGQQAVIVWRAESESDALSSIKLRRSSKGYVTAASFAADGESVLTGSSDGAAELWCAKTGVCLWALMQGEDGEKEKARVRSAALSPACDRVLVGTVDGITRVWSVTADGARPVCLFTLQCGSSVHAVAHQGWQ